MSYVVLLDELRCETSCLKPPHSSFTKLGSIPREVKNNECLGLLQ